ncbi:hypothetical protein [Bacillus sp. V33-4]|uniref:hypothetical protein n=1 Tax=Bacillus sp. V33-4 TaxID=2054169 RepID=UPI000C78DE3B|nr:hypothetical protein [Bacillus sp. V33-4]PLR84346.1 hypothetical protein CVD23_11985 [Bacillus sp. V33-4]
MKKLNFLTLLMVVLLMAACGTAVNNDSTSGNNDGVAESTETPNQENEVVEESNEETKTAEENKVVDNQTSEENVNTESNKHQVEFSGQIDQASIEVITPEGTPLALRIEDYQSNVNFETITAGTNAEIEYYTNEYGQNILTNFVFME